jgi:hypothetical protein
MNVMDRGFGHDAALDPESNCTLEKYAAAKALPVDFLSNLGLATTANPHAPRRLALAIPYRSAVECYRRAMLDEQTFEGHRRARQLATDDS